MSSSTPVDGDGSSDGNRAPAGDGAPAHRPAIRTSSLAGDLATFRAYDVCQLLGLARATGTLILRADGVRGAIYLDEGRVVGARSRPHPRRLGSLLLSSGAVDEPALARAVSAQIAGDRRPLGEILMAVGEVRPAALAAALVGQERAALVSLLILPAGRFAFARGLLPPGEQRLSGAAPQELVLDALARLDELNAGRKPTDGSPTSGSPA